MSSHIATRRIRPLLHFAVVVSLGLGLLLVFSNPADLVAAFKSFDLRLAPLLLVLAVVDYILRFGRWHLLVGSAIRKTPPLIPNLAAFLAANVLILAPARIGDFTRCVHARNLYGAPIAATASVPIMERFVDVLLMALFALGGVLLFGGSPLLAILGSAQAVTGTIVFTSRAVTSRLVRLLRRSREGLAAQAETFFTTMQDLRSPRPMIVAFGLGTLAWLVECAAFYVVLWGLGLTPSIELMGMAAFIYPLSNLAGGLSMLPGGIGVAEGSIAGLTVSIIGASAPTALAAAVLIRALILGFGVVTGLPGAAFVSRKTSGAELQPNAQTISP